MKIVFKLYRIGIACCTVIIFTTRLACPTYAAKNTQLLLPEAQDCGRFPFNGLTEVERYTGSNLSRLRTAEAVLAPGYQDIHAITGLHLIGAYQAELEKARPDPEAAASYLAMLSTVPINAERYRTVNKTLCVSVAARLARRIETTAEAERQEMQAPDKHGKGR